MDRNKPKPVCFDEKKAEQELKKCPQIVRDYVVLLKKSNDRMQDMVKKAVKKTQEELDKSHNFKVKLEKHEDLIRDFKGCVNYGEITILFEDTNSNATRVYHNLIESI